MSSEGRERAQQMAIEKAEQMIGWAFRAWAEKAVDEITAKWRRKELTA